jgi:hypothetical protein
MEGVKSATRTALLAACLLLAPLAGLADGIMPPIPDAETMDPPTPERLQAIEAAAAAGGWADAVGPLRDAALRAYAQDRFVAAGAWFHAYRWAALFSEPEDRFIDGWIRAVVAAGANYEGVAGRFEPTQKPIGLGMSPELQAWVLGNEDFSEEFFSNVKSVDQLPNVFGILEGLYRRDPVKFARYSSLALALAVVYDVVPPPYWPHGQVSADSLPRKLPNPALPYERLIAEDRAGRTYLPLTRMHVDELKYVVDASAPGPELTWSEENVPYALDQFEQAYFMVKYRTDRATSYSGMIWSGTPYTLQAILDRGGICVDQAYFASEAGKARGVPTLLFTGGGQDGRHAWFGFLDSEHHWHLDAGRYAEQRLVTGVAFDPQTWTRVSDHELQFLSERFRALPSYKESSVQAEFAEDFLEAGDAAAAAHAARTAVNYERRNVGAWEILTQANAKLALPPAAQEGVLREAALAFTPKYPDLVVAYVSRVCDSLRARGETSLANYEQSSLADRLKGDRADLAVAQAASILSRSISSQGIPDQIATYNAIIAQFGHGAGTTFFDQIVTAFAEHLALEHMKPEARDAVDRAREALEVQPGTQFSMDVDKLMQRLQD